MLEMNFDLFKEKPIVIISAPPRAGKTSLMAALQERFLFGEIADNLLWDSARAVNEINRQGYSFTPPPSPPVFSNFKVRVQIDYERHIESFYTNGFRFCTDDRIVRAINMPPCSVMFLAEAPKYWYNRDFSSFPPSVLRGFQTAGQHRWQIFLDGHHPGMYDLHIRKLCQCFVKVIHQKRCFDWAGNVTNVEWEIRVYDSFEDYEQDKNYKVDKPAYSHNVFELYDSYDHMLKDLPGVERKYQKDAHKLTKDFHYLPHPNTETEVLSEIYNDTEPAGYRKQKEY